METVHHTPVLLDEVIEFIQPEPGALLYDGTVGLGGHSETLLSRVLPDGRLIAVDRDMRNLSVAKERLARFKDRAIFIQGSYSDVKSHLKANQIDGLDGILLDLGYSSAHIEDASRGFSFQKTGPLDMRYDTSGELTAEMIVNSWSVEELATIFRRYGEERFAERIAKDIFHERKVRKIETTTQLAEIISKSIRKRGPIHPATRVFQALRIVVNDELGELERALPNLVESLHPRGRIVVLTFHSIEDRIIKQFFKNQEGLENLTKRVVKPKQKEIEINPRARSAKLRAAEKK